MKKAIPYLLIVILFVVALFVRQCREGGETVSHPRSGTEPRTKSTADDSNLADLFRDVDATYFFTKHARCRMECRHITQKEVKEIVQQASINFAKSEPDAPRGAKYALEGYTSKDHQHVRIIVAPKERHFTIVTVIDLDEDWTCGSCK
ncbi:MAG: DUF4258 domain-containing protein [Bacteroidetes bacterium]|nr:DUF4258 domain-containing protein [Bacteroidota bacterium]